LKHADGLYSSVSHLEPGSARVHVGQWVKRGEVLGLCGSSGRSPEPHLHFQFQATAKVGEKTLVYPVGCYLEEQDGAPRLRVCGSPVEHAKVQNLAVHRRLKDAFTFALESRQRWSCRFGDGAEVEESWEVKVDIYNSLYFESSAGAFLSFFATEKVFYLTHFRGNRRSALYYFYLCAAQMPLGYHENLHWADVLPLSTVLHSAVKPISELFLLAGPQIEARVEFQFDETAMNGRSPGVQSILTVKGKGLFGFYRKSSRGEVQISPEGAISGFECVEGERRVFAAQRIPVNRTQAAVLPQSPATV
jgi:murein DD-endopeptidase MepM/ murein hydrolase activator NlpD